ncbi:hypothetical protein pp309_000010 [Proteus phage 309]|uniref:Uncharacterized protein n=1 Tax=Proteus phage 309 TaxID=2894355 RepID=A0AAE9C800_9CAUD|nr:hypothetical protein pp309_000010 [Proteus phage 309]
MAVQSQRGWECLNNTEVHQSTTKLSKLERNGLRLLRLPRSSQGVLSTPLKVTSVI